MDGWIAVTADDGVELIGNDEAMLMADGEHWYGVDGLRAIRVDGGKREEKRMAEWQMVKG